MAEPSHAPQIEVYDTTSVAEGMRLKDFESLIYDDPGWLLSVMDGQSAQDEAAAAAKAEIDYATGSGAEDYEFDEQTEDYLFNHPDVQALIEQRNQTDDSDQKLLLRDMIRRNRLYLFIKLVKDLREQDDEDKITQLPPPDRPGSLGNAS